MGGPEMAPHTPQPPNTRGARRSRGTPRNCDRLAHTPPTLGAPRRSRGTPRNCDRLLVSDPRWRVAPLAHAAVHRLTIDRDERRGARPRRVDRGLDALGLVLLLLLLADAWLHVDRLARRRHAAAEERRHRHRRDQDSHVPQRATGWSWIASVVTRPSAGSGSCATA